MSQPSMPHFTLAETRSRLRRRINIVETISSKKRAPSVWRSTKERMKLNKYIIGTSIFLYTYEGTNM